MADSTWKYYWLLVINIAHASAMKPGLMPELSTTEDLITLSASVTSDLLQEGNDPRSTVVLFSDGGSSSSYLRFSEEVLKTGSLGGLVLTEAVLDLANDTEDLAFLEVVKRAKEVRQHSWVAMVVVVSEDPTFLSTFAEWSLKQRLLVWQTKLLVVTRVSAHVLHRVFAGYWTFSMMSSVVVNFDVDKTRGVIYTYLPYTASGPKLERLGRWSPSGGVDLQSGASLYPQKFTNFYGFPMNVTALPFAPYWSVEEIEVANGPPKTMYSGTDYLMLHTISKALNFTIRVLPTADWGEVTQLVEERVSFVAPIIYALLPGRLESYDYSYAYEFASPSFCMTKPVLKPQWQSLYYPLGDLVWLATLAVILVMPATFYFVLRAEGRGMGGNTDVVTTVVGTLLGQSLSQSFPKGSAARLLLGTWLIFAFILGTAYRGNLTASLTLPKYPPRPETLNELVEAVKKVTMTYGEQFRDFYQQSDSEVFRALGNMMEIGPSARVGLTLAIERRQAHIEARRNLELMVAQEFTRADGTTRLYFGRQSVFPGLSGWPLPHDAPYKGQLDRNIMAIKEAGLYEKWSRDVMEKARKDGREKRLKLQQEKEKQTGQPAASQEDVGETSEAEGNIPKALTIVHLQGPLLLAALGLAIASLAFVGEVVSAKCFVSRDSSGKSRDSSDK